MEDVVLKKQQQFGIQLKQTNRLSKLEAFDLLLIADQIPPLAFMNCYSLVQQLQSFRLVEKLARPIDNSAKQKLIRQVNDIIHNLKEQFDNIAKYTIQFRAKQQAIIDGQGVMAHEWKQHIFKIRNRVLNFQNVSLRYYKNIKEAFNLHGQIQRIQANEWSKDCLAKMRPFCFCG